VSTGSGIDRRRFMQLAGLSGAAALAGCKQSESGGGDAARTLKIGYVSPKTGPLAGFGEADDFILGGVRKALEGGLDVGGTSYPVEILTKDSQSDPNRAAAVAGDLINADQVDLMLVASTPETTNPVADQCEANGIPCISSVAPWQPWFFGRQGDPEKPFQWTYHFFWGLEDIIAVFADMWGQVGNNKVVAALWPNDGDGNAWGDKENGFPPALTKAGYKIVDPGRYQNGTEDFSSQIARF
jgi:branched-chain amino acid transport system substrate-binding protein